MRVAERIVEQESIARELDPVFHSIDAGFQPQLPDDFLGLFGGGGCTGQRCRSILDSDRNARGTGRPDRWQLPQPLLESFRDCHTVQTGSRNAVDQAGPYAAPRNVLHHVAAAAPQPTKATHSAERSETGCVAVSSRSSCTATSPRTAPIVDAAAKNGAICSTQRLGIGTDESEFLQGIGSRSNERLVVDVRKFVFGKPQFWCLGQWLRFRQPT